MRQIIFILITSALFSCDTISTKDKEKQIDLILRESIANELKLMHQDSSSYRPISWGQIDTVDAIDFKYKVSHQYIALAKFYTKAKVIDSLASFDMTFLIDTGFKVMHVIATKEYSSHFDKNGLDYKMFGSKELQKLAIKNGFDMAFFENNKNRLLLVGGDDEIHHLKNETKADWIKANLKGVSPEFLLLTDTVEHCKDLRGDECSLYIFKDSRLTQVINAP
jgi:hypothetical protein